MADRSIVARWLGSRSRGAATRRVCGSSRVIARGAHRATGRGEPYAWMPCPGTIPPPWSRRRPLRKVLRYVGGRVRERLDDASKRGRVVTNVLVIAELFYGAAKSSQA